MGHFGSVSSAQIDEFSRELARELAGQLPPKPTGPGSRPTPKKIFVTCEAIFAKALAFRQKHSLGIYKKARLGNSFRWELEALGYEKAFADEVSQRLVLYITGKR
jgi:hypothetical protein